MKLNPILLTPIVLVLVGILYAQNAHAPTVPQTTVASSSGRYQIVMSPVTAKNTFLIDTETGKTWQFTQFTDLEGDPTLWDPQTRIDKDQDWTAFMATHKFKKQP